MSETEKLKTRKRKKKFKKRTTASSHSELSLKSDDASNIQDKDNDWPFTPIPEKLDPEKELEALLRKLGPGNVPAIAYKLYNLPFVDHSECIYLLTRKILEIDPSLRNRK
ncbi:uncharacterized protein LOC118439421 [Folsomia candida]|uniref:Uncharacterized protein n=1 Tax=Folsomia candida TaxID=158441 RepID=A0A226D4A5_FOLCA|nr:uncharacterized protein LOC118439421 [Folsomia candida]OXA40013.1 hypothetical protein Fcan01_25365 [Folsomia candida]